MWKTTPRGQDEHFPNSILLVQWNPKEKYGMYIYYYQTNISNEMKCLIYFYVRNTCAFSMTCDIQSFRRTKAREEHITSDSNSRMKILFPF